MYFLKRGKGVNARGGIQQMHIEDVPSHAERKIYEPFLIQEVELQVLT